MNKTTVYRILERLEKSGFLHSFLDKDGLKRYAKESSIINTSQKNIDHPHFVCDDCGISSCLPLEVNIPSIITCDLRLNEPRYASLPNIMKAKKKPLDIIDASELGIDTKPRIQQIKVEEPPKRKAGIKVGSVEELVQKLKNEAKVI